MVKSDCFVRVNKNTKKLLDELKEHKRETYNDVLERLLGWYTKR